MIDKNKKRSYKEDLTTGNFDNIYVATDSLNKFMHNYCMDKSLTTYRHEVMLRCHGCIFNPDNKQFGECLMFKFKEHNRPDFETKTGDEFGVLVKERKFNKSVDNSVIPEEMVNDISKDINPPVESSDNRNADGTTVVDDSEIDKLIEEAYNN